MDDANIIAALEASEKVVAAAVSGDAAAFAAGHSGDCMINSPANRVISGAAADAAFERGLIAYHALDRRIEYQGKLSDDIVVIMGEETARPRGNAHHAGKTVRRRFTDILRRDEGEWKIVARQATVIAVED